MVVGTTRISPEWSASPCSNAFWQSSVVIMAETGRNVGGQQAKLPWRDTPPRTVTSPTIRRPSATSNSTISS